MGQSLVAEQDTRSYPSRHLAAASCPPHLLPWSQRFAQAHPAVGCVLPPGPTSWPCPGSLCPRNSGTFLGWLFAHRACSGPIAHLSAAPQCKAPLRLASSVPSPMSIAVPPSPSGPAFPVLPMGEETVRCGKEHARPPPRGSGCPHSCRLLHGGRAMWHGSWGLLKAPALDPSAPWTVTPRPGPQCKVG